MTPKLIYIQAQDYYHQIIPSIKGLHAHATEPASHDWIGATLRLAVQSASSTNLTPAEWDQAHFEDSCEQAKLRLDKELQALAKQFHLRRKESVLSQALMVWVFWYNGLQGNDLFLKATNHRRGGYLPWPNERRYDDTRMEMSINGSDTEIGEAVRLMQAQCSLSGKRPVSV